ncbi:TetR/AcrR family transcriptional regulator [Alteribacillus sp. HJP-4]|uniref:TetR/AcrR family transcriptional regulator n=1 Tax=Alteribacillus sp. HJP-4 TaxID=2775394 RepID=UPI0035CD1D04
MSPRRPIAEELRKDKIIYAARVQFLNKDFRQVSMRSIGADVKCSHSALYHHFKNKADLFYAIVEKDFSDLNRLIEKTLQEASEPEEKLSLLLLRFIEFGLNNQRQYEIMFLTRNSEAGRLSQRAASNSYQHFTEIVRTLTDDVKPDEILSVFLSVHGFVTHYCGNVQSFQEAEKAAEKHVEFVLKCVKINRS